MNYIAADLHNTYPLRYETMWQRGYMIIDGLDFCKFIGIRYTVVVKGVEDARG
jgi:hypothetical protein